MTKINYINKNNMNYWLTSIFLWFFIWLFAGVYLLYFCINYYWANLNFENACNMWDGDFYENKCIFEKIPTLNF